MPATPHSVSLTGQANLGLAIIDRLHVGVLVIDPEGKILDINGNGARLLRLRSGETVGRKALDVLPGGSVIARVVGETVKDQRGMPSQVGTLPQGDGYRTFRCGSSVIRDRDGEVRVSVCEFQDITTLVRMEEEMRQLDRLATIGRFASAIAHEIRNPLTGIYAGVQFLEKTLPPQKEQQEVTYRLVQSEVERLNRIVGDMLGAARPPEPQLVPTDPNEIACKVASLLETDGKKRSVRIHLDCDETLPKILLDPDLICQVLLNLGRNALEASPEGGEVSISTGVSPGSPANGILPRLGSAPGIEYRVRDQGTGIPDKDREHIFEPFHTSKKGGTGLGLFISFQIMERHNGALWVKTEEGKGSEFIARIPYQPGGGGAKKERDAG